VIRVTPERREVLTAVAELVCGRGQGHPLRVAVDGITGAGKTTFAGQLAELVRAIGRPALHVSMDGFHHPRPVRYRQGRDSPRGYYEDAYDFETAAVVLLAPLGPGGDRVVRTRLHDLETDAAVDDEVAELAPDAVLVVDGTFLQKPPLRGLWDVVIHLDTTFEAASQRAALRDSELFGGHANAVAAYATRYHPACRLYRADHDPSATADVLVDNTEPDAPVLQRLR
jgi:uridine kinase